MKGHFVLGKEQLERVKDSALFYPCSGNDLLTPIELFSPYVTDFWFVDRGYFSPGHQDTKFYGFDVSANKQRSVLEENSRYELLAKEVVGPPTWSPENRDITPCILTKTYRHIQTEREIKIRRRRGYGYSAFRSEINALGVFFYRGDSHGEGGSGNLWLKDEHIDEICNKGDGKK